MEEIKNVNSLLIERGRVVNEYGVTEADVFCKGGKIEFIGKATDIKEKIDRKTVRIDAKGKIIIPGGIDPHVHFDLLLNNGLKSRDNFKTGSIAALYGGTTSIIDFVTPKRGDSLIKSLYERREEAKNSKNNVYFHMSITEWNSNTAEEMRKCVYEEGIRSFKVYTAYRETIGLDYDDIYKVMCEVEKLNALLMVHCEAGEKIIDLKKKFKEEGKRDIKFHPLSRPPGFEAEAVRKITELACKTGCKTYIVHNSTEAALDIIRKKKKNGKIFVETCPHYLFFDDSVYQSKNISFALKYIMSPPLRKQKDIDALWNGIENGTIDVLSTDHCPFNIEDRKEYFNEGFFDIPNGVGGVEERLALIYTEGVLKNKISLNRFVELISTNAAKLFGLYPKKGVIDVGSDSDIVIWNPDLSRKISVATQIQNSDNSIYEGADVKGLPQTVIIGTKILTL